MMWAETSWEEINDGLAGANYGWPATEGTTTNPDLHEPEICVQPRRAARARSPAAPSTPRSRLSSRPTTSTIISLPTIAAGWIRQTRPPAGNSVDDVRDRSCRLPSISRSATMGALYYLTRGEAARVYRVQLRRECGPTITSHPTSQTVAPGASVTFSVRASGAAAARGISGSAMGSTFRERPRRITRSRRSPLATTAPASGRSVSNDFDTTGCSATRRTLTVSVEPGADRHDHATGCGHPVQRGMVDQLRRNGHRSRGRDAAGQRVHLAGGFSSRHPRRIRSCPPPPGRRSGSFTIPTIGRDLCECLVPHLPDGA